MLYNYIVPVVSKIPKRVDYKFNNFLEQIIFMCKNYEMFFYFEDFFKFIKYREATWNVIEWENNTEQV